MYRYIDIYRIIDNMYRYIDTYRIINWFGLEATLKITSLQSPCQTPALKYIIYRLSIAIYIYLFIKIYTILPIYQLSLDVIEYTH